MPPVSRNPYDLVLTDSGRMYTIDNGSNAGSSEVPVDEGPDGACVNEASGTIEETADTLHLVSGEGYYGGHPNPTRANKANTFNADEQSPVATANPVECDYRDPTSERGALTTFDTSVNGLAEYTASNFEGTMKGDLLAAGYLNDVYHIKLNGAGDNATFNKRLFSDVSGLPLDITTQGDADPFPGTIWVADLDSGQITVYEPDDSGECNATDADSDADGDGVDNADEADSGTDPCSAADAPPDYDSDKTPNQADSDDDNDGLDDTSDPFAVDPDNGSETDLPVSYSWNEATSRPGGLLGMGFTGLMTNGTADYETLFDPREMTVAGANGTLTVDKVSEGTASGTDNTQEYGFQFGVNATAGSEAFTVHTRIVAPFDGLPPEDYQSMGTFVGTGDQDNYVELVTSSNGGTGGVRLAKEVDGRFDNLEQDAVDLPGPDTVDLFLTVDPSAGTVRASYAETTGGVAGPRINLGDPIPIPASWFDGETGLAVGILSTSNGPGPEFPATWDIIEAYRGLPKDPSDEE